MCSQALPGPSRLLCTIPAPHPGFGHRYEAADAPDGRHDDTTEDDR